MVGQFILTILSIDNILTNLSGLLIHRFIDIRFSVEIQTNLQSRSHSTMDNVRLGCSQGLLQRKIRHRYIQQGVDKMESLHICSTSLHILLRRCVKRHTTKHVQTIQIKRGSQYVQLINH